MKFPERTIKKSGDVLYDLINQGIDYNQDLYLGSNVPKSIIPKNNQEKLSGTCYHFYPGGNIRSITVLQEDKVVEKAEYDLMLGMSWLIETKRRNYNKGTERKVGRYLDKIVVTETKLKNGEITLREEYITSDSGKCFPSFKAQYRNGKYHGKVKIYEAGTLRECVRFRNGRLHGFSDIYDKNGNLRRRSTYKNSRARGWEYQWDEAGKLKYRKRFHPPRAFTDGKEYGTPVSDKLQLELFELLSYMDRSGWLDKQHISFWSFLKNARFKNEAPVLQAIQYADYLEDKVEALNAFSQ